MKSSIWLATAIALATMAVFSPVLWHDFVNFDDPDIVYSNPSIRDGLTLDAIYWAFTSQHVSNWVPLTWISHMTDVQLFGVNPAGHHSVNLLFHVAGSVVLFLFFNRATKAPWRSAAVAFLFALHPLNVEPVAWVAVRKDVLSAFFWMLTLYAYAVYIEKPILTRYLAVLAFFLMGLLSKPMVVTLPVILLLLDWWPFERFLSTGTDNRHSQRAVIQRLIVEKIPFFLLSACVGIVTYLIKQTEGEIVSDSTLLDRIARAFLSYTEYISRMFYPHKLAVFYPLSATPPVIETSLFSAVVLIVISGAVFRVRKRSPFLLSGWFWYIVALLPVIGLIRSGECIVADRYTYLPLIGLFVMIAWGAPQLMEGRQSRRKVLGVLSAVALAGMVIVTSMQLKHWKNSCTLFSHAIEVTENNWLALNNLGLASLNEGRLDEAIRLFEESVKAQPSYVIALLNLGAAHSMKNDSDLAIDAFKRVLRFEPGSQKAHLSLGLLYLQKGEKESAMAECQALLIAGSPFTPYLLSQINAR